MKKEGLKELQSRIDKNKEYLENIEKEKARAKELEEQIE